MCMHVYVSVWMSIALVAKAMLVVRNSTVGREDRELQEPRIT